MRQVLVVCCVLWSALVSMKVQSCITCAWRICWLDNSKVNTVLIKPSCRQCSVRVWIYWRAAVLVSWSLLWGLGWCVAEGSRIVIQLTECCWSSILDSESGETFSSQQFLGALAWVAKSSLRLRHVCPSICLPVYLFVLVYQHGAHPTDFCKMWYWGLLTRYVEKVQIYLKSDKNVGYFTCRFKSVYVVGSSLKYLVRRQQCEVCPLLQFHHKT
jgi:hypothetical protein